MTNYYMVSYHAGNGIYCTNLATAENVEDIRRAYADHEQVTINPAKDYEIESAKRRGMPIVECQHVEPETETNETETNEEENSMNTIILVDIIAEATEKSGYAEYACDYYDSCGYICDTFAEIADNNTSIYYNDIMHYISEHVAEVDDIIKEFGWDGCGGDLYSAGQLAEYHAIESELYSAESEIIAAYAADYIRRIHGAEEIDRDLWESIAAELYSVDTSDKWNTIRDIVDAAMYDYNAANDDTDTAETVTA